MSGTATIAITVGVAVAVLVGFFIVYYLGNVANSIYDVKIGVRKDFDKKVKELQDWIEKDTKQRINWMRDENKEQSERFKDSMEGHLEETFNEMEKTIERLRADVSSLQIQVQALQSGKGGTAQKVTEAPPFTRPKAKKTNGLGDLDVPRVGIPEHEEAPDMAAPKARPAGSAAPTTAAEPGKPTPPPPPASAQEAVRAPSGRASLEKKVRPKKKKKGAVDEFETFNEFSEDFKSGR